ncbi:hypothetical protein AGLY_010095 [Aphis glycines]|uniref:Uncharacterized protein n=1 Tax=Aphis glycines TaxID=307491 RepID=A0A6G0TF29_APHGL|nr:hypothetical protein AGLY_010095 [Aphis glycines]
MINNNKFADALCASNFSKEKLYFEFVIIPSVSLAEKPFFLHCTISYYEYCLNNHTSLCADNQKTFREKGLFTKKYARRWVGCEIDLVDHSLACNCDGDQFISFHMILDAYNENLMVTIFIVILHILYISPNINAEKRQEIEIGTSGCRYSGYIDPEGKKCNGKDVMPIDDLPFACSSYFYDGVTCLDDFTIEASKNPNTDDNLLLISSLTLRVFLLYGRKNYIASWTNDNFYDGLRTESRNLQAFITDNPITGIVLTGIDGPINLMNLALDYYLITFRDFNDCTKELLNGGTTPMDSKDPKINTLNKFADALNALNIDREKVYLEFVMTPTIPFAKLPTTLPCEITYSEGLFAKKHAKGWVGYAIDLIDRQQACKCEGSYKKSVTTKFTKLLVLVLLRPRIPVGLGTIISGYNTDTAIGLLTQHRSYLDNLSLNSSMGRLIMSSTLIGIFRFLALFSSLVSCSSSLLLLFLNLLRGVLGPSTGNAYVWLRATWCSGVITPMCRLNCEEPGTGMPSLTDISYGRFNESGTRPTTYPYSWLECEGYPSLCPLSEFVSIHSVSEDNEGTRSEPIELTALSESPPPVLPFCTMVAILAFLPSVPIDGSISCKSSSFNIDDKSPSDEGAISDDDEDDVVAWPPPMSMDVDAGGGGGGRGAQRLTFCNNTFPVLLLLLWLLCWW